MNYRTKNDNKGSKNMNSFAVVRADDVNKVRVAMSDLVRYAHLTFDGKVRIIDPAFADNILVHIMRSPLRASCKFACIVALYDDASSAIGKLRKIHPPAHVIIVSPKHDIYRELPNYIDLLPEMDTNMEWDRYGYISTGAAESCGQ